MKIKIQKDQSINGTIVSYFKIKDIDKFRFSLLKRIIDRENTDVTLLIDTNQRKQAIDFDELAAYLKRKKVPFELRKIPANETKLFGISMSAISKKKRDPENLFVLSLASGQFDQEIFDAIISNYDIAIGFGRKMELVQIADKGAGSLLEVLFNDTCFENSLYDSALFQSLRVSMDIEALAKQACEEN